MATYYRTGVETYSIIGTAEEKSSLEGRIPDGSTYFAVDENMFYTFYGGTWYETLPEAARLYHDDVGTDTKPIKLVGGVATVVANELAEDSKVVHNTGNETIAGEKTLLTPPVVSASESGIIFLSDRSESSNQRITTLKFADATNPRNDPLSQFAVGRTAQYNYVITYLKKGTASHSVTFRAHADHMDVAVTPYYPVDGSGNPQALTANALMASGNIAVDPRLVHTTGNETVAGNKEYTGLATFKTAAPTINLRSTEAVANEGIKANIVLYGGTSTVRGQIYQQRDASSEYVAIRQQKVAGSGYFDFRLRCNASDVGWAECPSYTADNSADGKIVTRSMLAQSPTVVHTTGNETIAGTKTFSASTVINRLERGYTLTVIRAREWAKLYEFPPATYGANIVFNGINFWNLAQFAGAEVRVGVSNSPDYELSGRMYGIGGVLNGKVARRTDNTIEVWVQNATGSGIDFSTEITHQRSTTPKPIGQIGTMPVVGETYADVVDMTMIS